MIKHEEVREALLDLVLLCCMDDNEVNEYELKDYNEDLERDKKHIETYITEQQKKDELLDLYRLQHEFKERYNTSVRLLDRQECLDNIREIAEEIYLKEKELEDMK